VYTSLSFAAKIPWHGPIEPLCPLDLGQGPRTVCTTESKPVQTSLQAQGGSLRAGWTQRDASLQTAFRVSRHRFRFIVTEGPLGAGYGRFRSGLDEFWNARECPWGRRRRELFANLPESLPCGSSLESGGRYCPINSD